MFIKTKLLEWPKVILIISVAFALRASFTVYYDNHKFLTQEFFASDSDMYDTAAKNIMAGRGCILSEYQKARVAPLYPYFLAGMYSFFGHNIVLIRFVQALIGSFNCVLVFVLGREFFEERVGVLAGLIAACYYPFIQMPAYVMTEDAYVFLLLIFLICVFKLIERPAFGIAAITGFFFGLLTLCKGVLLTYIVLLLPGLFISIRQNLFKKIAYIGVLLSIAVVTMLPWVIRQYKIYKTFVPVTLLEGDVLYKGNSEGSTGGTGGVHNRGVDFIEPANMPRGLDELGRDRFLKKKATEFIKDNPVRTIKLAAVKFWNMWRPYHSDSRMISKIVMCVSYIPIVVFALAGLIMSMKEWRRFLIFYLLIAYYVSVHMVLIGLIRYRYPMEPILIIFCAYAVVEIFGKLSLKGVLGVSSTGGDNEILGK